MSEKIHVSIGIVLTSNDNPYRKTGYTPEKMARAKEYCLNHPDFNKDSVTEKVTAYHTTNGSETGSKKRYAGLVGKDSNEKIVFKGLESARSDWTPLAQEFQQQLYMMVFHNHDPSEYVRSMVERTQAGEFDHMLTYQKRLRRRLHEYEKNIPPQVRAARIADEKNASLGRPLQYQNRGRIEYLMTVKGPEPKEYLESAIDYEYYIERQLKPVAEAILPFVGCDFKQLIEPQLGLF